MSTSSIDRSWGNLSGILQGDIIVLNESGRDNDGRKVWLCACSCGILVKFTTKQIRTKKFNYCQSIYHRLIKQTYVDAISNCWIWTGKINRSGYAVCKEYGITRVAHRVMYRAIYGDFDEELKACHKCDVPKCINPFHIFIGTQRDNMLDMHAKGRFRGGAKPGNKNATGNKGWTKGGIVFSLGRVPKKFMVIENEPDQSA